ncbi:MULTISPECIES: hypothetical protein [unclassified Moorena]|uniref:hypothetical protein n=1 Tax=unclassified Moorena TaxID=2683338 RepID=UPI001400A425|nr:MULTISPECIES: hypothetical protein [unclassified Moorena]NEO13926.1 hypothetical protein [Moorena sp. SIO3E8]NEQ00344.1 hypothetical protein [Moorena sp. SIO3F7]
MNQDYQDPLATYQEQFKEIYAAIKNRDRGCLYAAIAYLDPENSEDICHYFGINKKSTLNKDIEFCKPFLFSPIKDLSIFKIPLPNEFAKLKEDMENQTVELIKNFVPVKDSTEIFTVIIPVAFILIALYFLYFSKNQSEIIRKANKNKNKNKNKIKLPEEGRKKTIDSPEPIIDSPQQRKPSVLCLVVPSHQLSGLNPGDLISSNRVQELISSASYFLCDGSVQAIDQKVNLNLSTESINYSSEEYAYIQLIIPEGEGMIAQESKYSLKKKLPDGGAEIQKIARLTNLDGLETFICA